jgi:hypothetical protein
MPAVSVAGIKLFDRFTLKRFMLLPKYRQSRHLIIMEEQVAVQMTSSKNRNGKTPKIKFLCDSRASDENYPLDEIP